MNKRFKIQGPYDNDNDQFLYWSNENGWGSFEEATIFKYEEMHLIRPPMEATHVVWIDNRGEMESTNRIQSYLWRKR